MRQEIKSRHRGCDRCALKCENPITITVYSKTIRGHKDCMHYMRNQIVQEYKIKQKLGGN